MTEIPLYSIKEERNILKTFHKATKTEFCTQNAIIETYNSILSNLDKKQKVVEFANFKKALENLLLEVEQSQIIREAMMITGKASKAGLKINLKLSV